MLLYDTVNSVIGLLLGVTADGFGIVAGSCVDFLAGNFTEMTLCQSKHKISLITIIPRDGRIVLIVGNLLAPLKNGS